MKTTKLSKVLIVLLCSVSFITTHAQGLSLSFNLSETDTLSNMIADSKKYEISSLTLSGYINSDNTQYIIDLNKNGKLRNLDVSKISDLDYYAKRKYTYSYEWGGNIGSVMIDLINEQYPRSVAELNSLLKEHAPGYRYRLDMDSVIIEDKYRKSFLVRSFHFYYDDEKTSSHPQEYSFEEHFNIPYSLKTPKIALGNCKFDKFAIPNDLMYVGGDDMTYSVAECTKYVLGTNVCVFRENAFNGAYIETMEFKSPIDSIKAGAFENATGNILTTPLFLKSVKCIDKFAFKNSNLLNDTDGTITLQVEKIGTGAFYNAVVPNKVILLNVEEMGDSAFMASSTSELELNNKIQNIGNSVFENCKELSVFIGGLGIESIGLRTFYGCNQLKRFIPSNTLKSIGDSAFAKTSSMVEFSIPDATKIIGHGTFANSGLKKLQLGRFGGFVRNMIEGCDSLGDVSVDKTNSTFSSVGGVLFSKDKTKIIFYPCAKKDALYEIPNSVIEIADSAFYEVNKLGALVIPESVKTIGKNAFGNSSILELKALPSTTPKVTYNISGLDQSLVRLFVHDKDYSTYYIANYWGDFKNIFVLENAVSPDNLINVEVAGTLPNFIGFGNQFKYNSLRLSGKLNGDDIRYLREMAGRDVNGKETAGVLTNLDFSLASIVKGGNCYYEKSEYSSGKLTTADNVIGESMFEGCKFTNLAISESTTNIGDKALYGCPLTTFRLPSATQSITMSTFYEMFNLKEFVVDNENSKYKSIDNVLFTKDGKTLLLYPYAKEGEKYKIPETVTTIDEQAFGGSHLITIIANEGLKEIRTLAFNNLGSLEAISLPSTLERIGHRAFWGCNKFMEISCKAYYPPTLKYDSYSYFGQPYNNFSDKTYENAVLFVPQKNGGYKSRSGWKLFNNVIESDDWMKTSADETITISDLGKSTYCSSNDLDFSEFGDDLKAYVATGYDPDSKTIWMTRVTDVPAGTGIFLKGQKGDYRVPVKTSTSYYKNMLVGTLSSTNIPSSTSEHTNLYLAKDGGELKFCTIAGEGRTMGANKAYLQIPKTFKSRPASATATTESIKLTEGKSTYCSSNDLDFTSMGDALKAYVATGYTNSTGTIWMTRVYDVPAGTGIFLKGENKTHSVPTKVKGGSSQYESYLVNMLVGTLQKIYIPSTTNDYKNMYLTKEGGVLKFCGIAGDGRDMNANRAYLQIPLGVLSKTRSASFGEASYAPEFCDDVIGIPVEFGSTTSMMKVSTEDVEGDNVWYNLNGQRVENPGKGLYIRNGHKVVIK